MDRKLQLGGGDAASRRGKASGNVTVSSRGRPRAPRAGGSSVRAEGPSREDHGNRDRSEGPAKKERGKQHAPEESQGDQKSAVEVSEVSVKTEGTHSNGGKKKKGGGKKGKSKPPADDKNAKAAGGQRLPAIVNPNVSLMMKLVDVAAAPLKASNIKEAYNNVATVLDTASTTTEVSAAWGEALRKMELPQTKVTESLRRDPDVFEHPVEPERRDIELPLDDKHWTWIEFVFPTSNREKLTFTNKSLGALYIEDTRRLRVPVALYNRILERAANDPQVTAEANFTSLVSYAQFELARCNVDVSLPVANLTVCMVIAAVQHTSDLRAARVAIVNQQFAKPWEILRDEALAQWRSAEDVQVNSLCADCKACCVWSYFSCCICWRDTKNLARGALSPEAWTDPSGGTLFSRRFVKRVVGADPLARLPHLSLSPKGPDRQSMSLEGNGKVGGNSADSDIELAPLLRVLGDPEEKYDP